jgi:hypothetical protein
MERVRWEQLIDEARANAKILSAESPTRQAAPPEWLEALSASYPSYGHDAPPLLLHLSRLGSDQLRAFDSDLEAVRAATPAGGSRQEFLAFGRQIGDHQAHQWFAGLLEMAVQAHLLRAVGQDRVEISPRLPSGQHADATVSVGGRRVWIEVSALSDDDGTIDQFDTAASVQMLHGDPYLDARRVYRKVFDKVTGTADKRRSQLHPGEPSIVVIGDATRRSAGHDGLGFGWALDQLTDTWTREDHSAASLTAWIAHDFPSQEDETLAALAALSAVAVVGGDLTLIEFRVNHSADDAHRLRADEIESLRELLDPRPSWRR